MNRHPIGRGAWAICAAAGLALTAAAYEEDPRVIELLRMQLGEALRPQAALLFNVFNDESDILFQEGGAEALVWATPWLPVRGQYFAGRVEQDRAGDRPSTEFDRRAVNLWIDELRLTPQFILTARGTLEELDDDDLGGGRLMARWQAVRGTKVGVFASRDSFWTRHDSRDPRQYPRLTDLSRVEPDFRLDTIEAFLTDVPLLENQLKLQAGLEDYDDDNRRTYAYAHYQLPFLSNTPDRWMELRPNLYYESYRDETNAYYSADWHVSVGLAAHTVRTAGRGRLEAEIGPIMIFRDREGKEEDEYGIHGVLDLSRKFARAEAGVGGFVYAETDDYWLWRVSARLGTRF